MPWFSSGWFFTLFQQPTRNDEDCEEDDDDDDEELQHWRSVVHELVDRTDRCLGVDHLDHMQQSHDWDCGIVCLEMILHAWFASTTDTVVTREWLAATIDTQSTWTADVVFVLHTFLEQQASSPHTVSYIFSSQSLAVNENLRALPFYAQQFARDTQRVQTRLGHHGLQRSRPYPLSEILDCVQYRGCVAILLVDANRLRGSNQQRSNATLPYTGHYLVVVGVQQEEKAHQRVVVNDPGVAEGRQSLPVERLEQAWHATGTDSDVILLVRHAESLE